MKVVFGCFMSGEKEVSGLVERVLTLAVVLNEERPLVLNQEVPVQACVYEGGRAITPIGREIIYHLEDKHKAKVTESPSAVPSIYARFSNAKNLWYTGGLISESLRKADMRVPVTVMPKIYSDEETWWLDNQKFGDALIRVGGEFRHLPEFEDTISQYWFDIEEGAIQHDGRKIMDAYSRIMLVEPRDHEVAEALRELVRAPSIETYRTAIQMREK